MRSTPFEVCPAADDLLSYVQGTADDQRRPHVAAHIATCGDCQRALVSLQDSQIVLDALEARSAGEGFLARMRRRDPEAAALAERSLTDAQHRMRTTLTDPRPEPAIGQIWATRNYHQQSEISHLVLVLDEHLSAATEEPRVNLVPVTTDNALAAEWSLILPSEDSGVGFQAVLHIDFERSASVECLDRCLGRLPADAGAQLVEVVQAWSRAESPPSYIAVGSLGRPEIRTRVEWQAFAAWLNSSLDIICRSTDVDTAEEDEAPTSPTGGAPAPSSPQPANPLLIRRPTAAPGLELIRSAGMDTELPRAREDTEPIRRVAEASHVYEQPPTPVAGFLDAAREYLAAECNDDLAEWSRRNSLVATWDQLGLLLDYSLLDLEGDSWRSGLASRLQNQPRAVRDAILVFTTQLRYFRVQRARLLSGQTLGQQAARRQTPSPSRPRQK
jgi:hypothetical protein